MNYFCKLDTSYSLERTNLQLYSLTKAADEWNKLIDLINNSGIQEIDNLTERLVFIINCLGLSLSQLMGQNCPSSDKDKMEMPGKLLSNLLNRSNIDRIIKNRLNSTFSRFLEYYSAIRHFGKIKDDKNYKYVDKLSIPEVNTFRSMTIEIWDIVIAMHRKDTKNEIDEFLSISEIIVFDELENMPSP